MRRIQLIALLLIGLHAAPAQEPTGRLEVSGLRFEGNDLLNDDQLFSVIRTRETPWTMWKFLYFNVSEKLGEKPSYFDPVVFASDYAQVQRFYEDQGFFSSRVDTSLIIDTEDRSVDITFRINEGPRSYIDTVRHAGLDSLSSDIVEEINGSALISRGSPFIVQSVEGELRRVVSIFENNGYINAKVEPPLVRHYASTNNVSVLYRYRPGKRYMFGKIRVQQDTTVKERIEEPVIRRHLDFDEGDFFSEQKKVESERNLNRLGVFEASKIENSIPAISALDLTIPINVQVRTRPFQELTPEIGLNDQDNAFNLLLGVGYSHRNFLGGARNFSTRVRFNLRSVGGFDLSRLVARDNLQDTTNIYKLEVATQLVQPYFINNKTTISATLSGTLVKERQYYAPIYSARTTVTSQAATHTRVFVDWALELIDPIWISTGQPAAKIAENGVELYVRQFNSFLTLTLQRDHRNDIFSPTDGSFASISLEESGILPRAFGGLFGSDLPYAQYVKAVGTVSYYWDQTRRKTVIWATRLQLGAAQIYGNSPAPVPITRRFYGGGSGSVRGWRARDLGALPNTLEGGTAIVEANVESRWNLFIGSGSLWFLDLEKVSLVFFTDVGDVWTDPRRVRANELAVASGFGFRYNTIAGPIRIDFGFRVYNPFERDGQRWITERRFVGQTLSDMVFHIGIGHAF